ncbi:hypothetical protein NPX13_g3673 [Xylaria arbuscula]|uniref:F-box domain-containing protein n=1 Tax=Xylaria arbuscula TaxID=114810 RepID=A0A9W8NI05_9PEZI|nr:hypothetical protein NPX13_g3673 [Xylaria arbuscula]
MDESFHRLPGLAWYTKQRICDNTLDNAQLETRCPLDNGRHYDASVPLRYSAGKLDQLPAELLVIILQQIDIPSLTRFRHVNRRAMELVDSLPSYNVLVKHCPNIIRAILSVQADSFDCNKLYQTLSTKQCSTCTRFGDHLYLIDCRRVCYFCYTRHPGFFPLTTHQASAFFTPNLKKQRKAVTSRQLLRAAKPPSILSLPGRYCTAWGSDGGNLARKRLQLYDRRSVIHSLAEMGLPKLDRTTREPRRFMAIITAPYLFDSGRHVDWGYFCTGCNEEKEKDTRHFRIKYTKAGLLEHFARYGPVEKTPRIPGRFTHATPI